MVPNGYPTEDSHTVRVLREELAFVIDVQPGPAADSTADLFIRLLERHGPELRGALKVNQVTDGLVVSAGHGPDSPLGFIFAEKMTAPLIDALIELGMARPASDLDGERRFSMGRGDAPWIGLDARLAAVYMCVLAEEVSSRNNLSPVTDQMLAHLAVNETSIEDVADLLLSTDLAEPGASSQQPIEERVAFMALQTVMPARIESVSPETIARFRLRHKSELEGFQEAVALAASDVRTLGPEADAAILTHYVSSAVEKHLLRPREDLQNAFRSENIDTILAGMSMQIALPALSTAAAVGVVVNPALGGGVGAAIGIVNVARRRRKNIQSLENGTGAAAYLLDTGRGFNSRKTARRLLKAIGGTSRT